MAKAKSATNSFTRATNDYYESNISLTSGVEYWPVHGSVFLVVIYGLSNVTPNSGDETNHGVQIMAAVKF